MARDGQIGGASKGSGPLVFISYAHEEKQWLRWLNACLKQYEAAGEFERWDDDYIKVGDQWRREIDDALARARVGVLLTSTPFLASDFIRGHELPGLVAAADSGALRIVCVPVSAGDFEHAGLTRFQWCRPIDHPLDLLPKAKRSQELVRIAREIREAALASPAPPRAWTPSQAPYQPLVATTDRDHRQPGRLYGVPALPPYLVSRTGPIRETKGALLGGTASVAICGVGGSGKSILAAELARDPDLLWSFPDGVFWLSLGETPPLVPLLQQFLNWLEPARVPDDLSGLREGLRTALANRSCLLVLDDIWGASDALAFDVLGAQCRILMTTRNRAVAEAIHARILFLDTVSENEALELMARRSGVALPDLTAETRKLAARVGGLPLALTLVAAQVSAKRSWATVSKAFDRANAEYDQDQSGSVFSAMQAAVDSLDVVRRERLCDLAIFPEDEDLPIEIVLALWESGGLSKTSGRQLVYTYAERGLLQRTDHAVRLHDLQRDYLQLRVENLTQIHGRLLGVYSRKIEGQWVKLPEDNRYLWKYLAYHLAGAERSEDLQDLLLDPLWAAGKIRLDGVASLVADFEYVAAIPGMLEVQSAIRQSAHVFATDWRQLPSQLAGRIARKDARAISHLHERLAGFDEWPWLRPLSQSLAPPPGLQRTLEMAPGNATTLAHSQDDRLIAGTDDGRIRSWDVSTGAEFWPLAEALGFVYSVRLTASGDRLLSTSEHGGLQLWDLRSGTVLWQRHFDGALVRAEPAAADGSRAILQLREQAEGEGGVVRLFVFEDEAAGWASRGAHRMVIAAGGDVVLAMFGHTELRKIDMASGRLLSSVSLPAQPTAIAISADGEMCASGDEEGRVYLWDGHRAPLLLGKEQEAVQALAFASAPDELLVSDGILPHFVLWHVPSRQRRLAFRAHGWVVRALIPCGGGRQFASAADKTVKLWNLDSATEQRGDPVHHLPVPATAFSSDGRMFVSGGNDGRVAMWNVGDGTLVERVLGGGPQVRAVWVSADAARVAWQDEGKTCVVRARGAGETDCLRLDDVTRAVFNRNVDRGVVVQRDTHLSVWSLQNGLTDLGPPEEISDVQIAASGRWALSSHRSGTVRLWDVPAGRLMTEDVNEGVAQITFWPSGLDERAGWLWPSGQARVCELPAMSISKHTWPANRELTPDPSILIGRDTDPTITVIVDVDRHQEFRTKQPAGPMSVGPDGRRLIAAAPSFSRVLTIWDVRTGDVVATFTAGEGETHSPCWSPDGRVVVVAERVGTLHFLRLEGI